MSVKPQLTPRETAVLRHLTAFGGTDKTLAAELRMSPRTVEQHLRNIRNKIGPKSREGLREWFARQTRASE